MFISYPALNISVTFLYLKRIDFHYVSGICPLKAMLIIIIIIITTMSKENFSQKRPVKPVDDCPTRCQYFKLYILH